MTTWSAKAYSDGTLHLAGEIDYSVAPQVRRYLHDYAGSSANTLLLNLQQVEYIDSTGLAILLELRRILLSQERSISIVKASEGVARLFTLTQVAALFGMEEKTGDQEGTNAS